MKFGQKDIRKNTLNVNKNGWFTTNKNYWKDVQIFEKFIPTGKFHEELLGKNIGTYYGLRRSIQGEKEEECKFLPSYAVM
jgi:hypothetical protein